ncbi:MAG: hypothetical protein WCP53_07560 [Verrucomicrobiota bacterium]
MVDLATADTLERSPELRWVIIGSSAFGAGMLLASLTGLEQGASGLEFHVRLLSVPAFIVGSVVASAYWWLVFHLGAGKDDRSARRQLHAASGLILLLALAVFMYPLRFVTPEKRDDVLIGLAIAVGALSCVGFMIRTVVRMLEEEDAANPPPPNPCP